MKMSRQQFLQTSGASLLGMTVFKQLPLNANELLNEEANGKTMIEIKTKRLNLTHTWTIARNSSDFKDNVFVRLERDGIVGYGEAAPNVRYGEDAVKTTQRMNEAKAIFETQDWRHYVNIKTAVDKTILDQSCAKCALDIALMDWVGKKLNTPLYRLFGLDKSQAARTSFSIGIDTPEVIKQKIKEAEAYPLLKIKVGKDNDAEILDTVRSVTDKPLRVDANEGWKTKEVALEKIKWLETMGVELIEQPLPASMTEEHRWLRERVNMPIVADEAVKSAADIPKIAEAYDGINIKLMKAGGIQETLTMIQMARALGLKIMVGCMIESSVAITAAAHLSPLIDWADLDGNLLISNDPFKGVEVKEGKLMLNDKPGLGVEGEF
ncbi:MAG: L-Ala-D/L-Glu epimerase [Syntrophorhabdaceae bacterium]|nr:L-Ala-D/L-Glu epimerase [Syntrophorhabdaceae bacterium]